MFYVNSGKLDRARFPLKNLLLDRRIIKGSKFSKKNGAFKSFCKMVSLLFPCWSPILFCKQWESLSQIKARKFLIQSNCRIFSIKIFSRMNKSTSSVFTGQLYIKITENDTIFISVLGYLSKRIHSRESFFRRKSSFLHEL